MSAPTTNIERQAGNRRAPIWGILAALVFGGLMGAAITFSATNTDDPEGANAQIDGRTGTVVETE
ncbi:hypothetical protein [Pseudooceanicola nitratireducens]|uniref:hypothetical protein n=1 Tax=Pseudooceanicola nitratireducens TaxID=517719 RepID=UPI003C7DF593